MTNRSLPAAVLALLVLASGGLRPPLAAAADGDGFVPLFNGKDLTGWTPKITGYPAGENYGETFRVEDGVLKVSYANYPEFAGKFGHLFYKDKLSHYVLRVEYRFVGEQAKNGPGWALRNSGVMFHAQSPGSMAKGQNFPVSIEAQFLGGGGKGERPSGSVCTPGTNIVMGGKLITEHCTRAKGKTYHGDQWVTAEIEVHGNGPVKHVINGEVVMEYEKPQLDERDKDAVPLIAAAGGEKLLSGGYIALQAESHPIEFRKVEVRRLKE